VLLRQPLLFSSPHSLLLGVGFRFVLALFSRYETGSRHIFLRCFSLARFWDGLFSAISKELGIPSRCLVDILNPFSGSSTAPLELSSSSFRAAPFIRRRLLDVIRRCGLHFSVPLSLFEFALFILYKVFTLPLLALS